MTTIIKIEGQRLELFKSEEINITSSQQNISDIDQVKTDFSRSFDVPASDNNNRIFQHFYQSDVDATIDHNIRRNAVIELDYAEFRTGKVQIEKSNLKNGQPESYTLTFYGDIVSLKDKFNEDLLSDLEELVEDAFPYTQENVFNAVQNDTITPTKFPLIVNRALTYGDNSNDLDISHTGNGSINTNELFPAVNLKSIFEAMEDRYDINLNGAFLDDDRFKKAYLYCKNAKDFQFISKPEDVSHSTLVVDPQSYNTNIVASDYFSGDSLTMNPLGDSIFPVSNTGTGAVKVQKQFFSVACSSISDTTAVWYLDIYRNGAFSHTTSHTGNLSTFQIQSPQFANDSMSTEVYTFKVRATKAITMTLIIGYTQQMQLVSESANITTDVVRNEIGSYIDIATSQDLVTTQYMPKMKVMDFFKGVLNMFNLTCYNTGGDNYQLEPLDSWYQKGAIVDITKHVDIETIAVDRVPLYKTIDFKYEDSKSLHNEAFSSINKKEYGDASSSFEYDGGKYEIKLPFENLHQNRFTNTDLQVGMTIDTSGASYIPNPIILYMGESTNADYRLNDGDTNTSNLVTSYVPFGQDLTYNGEDYSLNFSADISTLKGVPIQNNLFATYYYPYLGNLYNLKNRKVSLKAVLPISILTRLELNDRLIIRNKRYIINSMDTNLNTGEVQFTLLHDFRPVIAESGASGGVGSSGGLIIGDYVPSTNAQCINVPILFPKDAVSATITDDSGDITSITPSVITQEQSVTVCIPEATTGGEASGYILNEQSASTIGGTSGNVTYRILTEESDNKNEYFIMTEDGVSTTASGFYFLKVTYQYSNGTSSFAYITISQEDNNSNPVSTAPNQTS